MLGKLGLLDLLPELRGLGLLLVHLTELLLDRLELLAQEELALSLLHLRLDLRLDLRADRDQLELSRQQLREPPKPLRHAELLQQLLALFRLDPQGAGDHVGELGGILQVGDRHLELLGQVGHLLDDPRERALHVAEEAFELGGGRDVVGYLLDAGHEVGLRLDEFAEPDPLGPVNEDAKRAVGHLHHPGDGACDPDVVDLVRPRVVGLRVAGRSHHQHPVSGEHVVHELDRAVLADGQGGEDVGEGDAVLQRKDR